MCGKFYYKWQIANCSKSISDYQRQKEDLLLHDSGADASFCIFFAPVANCIFTVWAPLCEENRGCSEGCNPFGSGFPIGGSSALLAHDFAQQSLVC